ncbi:hypothetical protein [Stenotrophomonas sp. NPDC077659]|uniref:hypothetical protein n=1 Tax=Stenotrophomonas sp. NPDC077659 TaxID=3390694 RepID=UPI003CFD7C8A
MRHRRPALVPLPPPREDDAPYLAFAWFRQEEYASFKALLPDRDWHDTFAEWQKDVERHLWLTRVNGIGAVRVTVPLADFVEWCLANGLPVESSSLSKFASAQDTLLES